MVLRKLIAELSKIDPRYLDSEVERAIPTGNGGYVGEPVDRVLQTVPEMKGKPLPESYRKVILL